MLGSVDISESDYSPVPVETYGEASERLRAGEADAAFFLSSTPAIAVKEVMSSGCCRLLDLGDNVDSIRKDAPDLSDREIEIAPYTYPNQPHAVRTLGASVLLVAHQDLNAEIVNGILDRGFDHLSEFEVANIRVQDVRLDRAFDLPERVDLHTGAAMFKDRERGKLWIVTGVINGKYYDLGQRIHLVLQQSNIPSRVIHTDGSIENLQLLGQHDRVIAITQYDIALASLWSKDVYGRRDLAGALHRPAVEGVRRIAALHEEIVHVLMRRDRLPKGGPGRPTLRALETARVCLGAPGSGTQVLAQLLLGAHGVTPKESVLLSFPDMVARINSGELYAGFFVSNIHSEVLKTVANDDRNVLLSVDPRSAA